MPPELVDRPSTPIEPSLARLDSLVSPYVGVVRRVEEVLAEPWDIGLHNVCCETGFTGSLLGYGASRTGAGSGRDLRAARAAGIAETVERYSATDSAWASVEFGSAADLGPRTVAPERFALYSARQYAQAEFPYARFDADTPVAWVEAFSLPDLRPALVPAQLVYLTWELLPGEARIADSTSSGLACHASLEEAVVSGLLELFERDAFMITWKARLSFPLLRWSHDSSLGRFERTYVRPTGLIVSAVDLSEFWSVPCVLGVARSAARDEAAFGVGAAAAETVERAAEKALDEAVRVRTWARALRVADPGGATLPAPDEIRRFDEHVQHYAYDEHSEAVAFLDGSEERRDASSVAPLEGGTPLRQIAACCRRLAQHGLSAYVVDVTAPDVRDAGLFVAKVVVPELCDLDVEHGAQHNGGIRLYEEPVRLRKCERRLAESELNPDPHPFP